MMAASIQVTDTIDGCGFPLAFKVRQGTARLGVLGARGGRDLIRVEARALGGHQKEAVVTEGAAGSAWRMVSDEGPALQGTDLAPFPLGFMSAGLQADLLGRIEHLAPSRGVVLRKLAAELVTLYTFEGSFFKGDGKGSASAPVFRVMVETDASEAMVRELVTAAMAASPLIVALRTPLENTFALHANGQRRTLTTLRASRQPDAIDPMKSWTDIPRPLDGAETLPDLIAKAGAVAPEGRPAVMPAQSARIEIPIHGCSSVRSGVTEAQTWISRMGGTRFTLKSDERSDHDLAPAGLSLAYAGIAFCLMTQLLRYVEYHKMDVRALRIVQDAWCEVGNGAALPHALDTHVFVHGNESGETMERLLRMAANTCYLHAALNAALDPEVTVIVDGGPAGPPASAD